MTALLTTPAELDELMRSGRAPVVLDVRWRLGGPHGGDAYREAHIPGAVFADLDSLMEEAGNQTQDPFEGLRLRGIAYVRFALANPEQYRLAMMTMPGRHDLGKSALMYEDIVVGQTYGNLMGAVQRCIDVGVFAPGTDAQTVATTLWAAAHGAVSLCLAKPDLAGDHAEAMCALVIEHAGMGAALSSYVGGHSHADGGADHDHEQMSANLVGLLKVLGQMSEQAQQG